jgi:hypothetical protein
VEREDDRKKLMNNFEEKTKIGKTEDKGKIKVN